jgi:hypothetical protein
MKIEVAGKAANGGASIANIGDRKMFNTAIFLINNEKFAINLTGDLAGRIKVRFSCEYTEAKRNFIIPYFNLYGNYVKDIESCMDNNNNKNVVNAISGIVGFAIESFKKELIAVSENSPDFRCPISKMREALTKLLIDSFLCLADLDAELPGHQHVSTKMPMICGKGFGSKLLNK